MPQLTPHAGTCAMSALARQARRPFSIDMRTVLLSSALSLGIAAASVRAPRCVPTHVHTWGVLAHTSCRRFRAGQQGSGDTGRDLSNGVSALRCVRRTFHTFHGSPQDFAKCVEAGPVMVFFYKAECVPCAEIRSKLTHAADRIVHTPAAQTLSGKIAEGEESALRGEQMEDGVVVARARGDHASASASTRLDEMNGDKNGLDMSKEDIKRCLDVELAAQLRFRRAMRCIRFVAVNTDENDRVTALHDVRSLPTFVAYLDGCIIGRVEGGRDSKVMQLLDKLMLHVDSEHDAHDTK